MTWLGWICLLSCVGLRRDAGPQPVQIPGPMVLGWRLVPGDQLVYEHQVSWSTGEQDQLRRVERWSYLVREVDSKGVATLEGSLQALGVERVEGGQVSRQEQLAQALLEEKARLSEDQITLRLAMDGRLVSIEGLPWSDSLSHRLLGLQLADQGVSAESSWPDPVLARPYADLLPVSLDVQVSGSEQVRGLYSVDGELLLQIQGRGSVLSTQGGPQVLLEGESWWDPQLGRLAARDLQVSMANLSVTDPGLLKLHIEAVD